MGAITKRIGQLHVSNLKKRPSKLALTMRKNPRETNTRLGNKKKSLSYKELLMTLFPLRVRRVGRRRESTKPTSSSDNIQNFRKLSRGCTNQPRDILIALHTLSYTFNSPKVNTGEFFSWLESNPKSQESLFEAYKETYKYYPIKDFPLDSLTSKTVTKSKDQYFKADSQKSKKEKLVDFKDNEKRIYRQSGSEALLDPTASPRAEVNRLTKLFSARIDGDLVAEANQHIKENLNNLGLETKAQWVEKAVKDAIQNDLLKLKK